MGLFSISTKGLHSTLIKTSKQKDSCVYWLKLQDRTIIEQGYIFKLVKKRLIIIKFQLYHKYHLLAFEDPVVAHKYAATVYLGYPKELPNEIMIVNPIWTTWAKYKKYINDTVVREFAYEIEDHGFGGQIEIDEQWEVGQNYHIYNSHSEI